MSIELENIQRLVLLDNEDINKQIVLSSVIDSIINIFN